MDAKLTEQSELEACEKVIAKGLSSFVDVGNALLRIRDGKLYRHTHATFAAYCKERWDMAKSQAYRVIEAAQVVGVLPLKADDVKMSPIGDKSLPAPPSESVVRPLSRLPKEDQATAYANAVKLAGGEAPTAKQVQDAVEEIKEAKSDKRSPSLRPSDGMQYAKMAINQLEKINPRDTQRTEAFDHVIAWISKQN